MHAGDNISRYGILDYHNGGSEACAKAVTDTDKQKHHFKHYNPYGESIYMYIHIRVSARPVTDDKAAAGFVGDEESATINANHT